MGVSHKSMRNFHLVLRRNPENFIDVPGRINHRCLAGFRRADEINVIVHRADFDLFEIKWTTHSSEVRDQMSEVGGSIFGRNADLGPLSSGLITAPSPTATGS